MRSSLLRLALTISVLGTATVCIAQDRPVVNADVSYATLKDDDVEGWFGNGWKASIAAALTNSLELVGEVGSNEKSLSTPEIAVEADISILSYGGGVRFVRRANPRVNPFAQVLVGAARLSAGLTACGALPQDICDEALGFRQTDTFLALQPGGGVDVFFNRHVGLRLQGDYRAIFAEDEDLNVDTILHEFRFAVGLVFTFGRR